MKNIESYLPRPLNIFFIILFVLIANLAFCQVEVKVFNAEWNKANDITWVKKLNDVKNVSYTDIAKDTEAQKKYKIAVVPTIIIFKDGEEVSRFQADLSFKITATREEVQEEIDELLMEDF